MDDFCLTHGYEHMKWQFGNPIPFCEACEREKETPNAGDRTDGPQDGSLS